MDNIIQTAFGPVSGINEKGVTRFSGIPYAQPPVGDLRFRAPQMIEPWTQPLDATRYAKDPMQRNPTLGPEHYSEDCLYLNIWVPAHTEEKLPVMVWIPGGAYATGGSGADQPEGPCLYDCATLARDTGCVIVSVSYRLNVFGFLNLSRYSDRFDDDLGMKDLIMALKWVNRTIDSFGGDPENVTIFGQSAGGGAVSALMLIDEAGPYFHKAIIQSNCWESFYTPEEEHELASQYLEYAGLDTGRVDSLLDLSYEALLSAGEELDAYVLERWCGRCAFAPVVDGRFIKEFPSLAAFAHPDKPVLVGSNRNEGNFQTFFYKAQDNDAEQYGRALLARLPAEQRDAVLRGYLLSDRQGLADLLTDVMYTVPKLRFAEHLSRHGKVYVYRYDYVTPIMRLAGLKACHVAELIPLFDVKARPYGTLTIGARVAMKQIGGRMRHYWGAFARSGNPNVPRLPEWKPYEEQHRYTMVINRNDQLIPDADNKVRTRYTGIDRILI